LVQWIQSMWYVISCRTTMLNFKPPLRRSA
jgi:hypothetical protein